MSNQEQNKRSSWLDQLQEQSWNLELIITGFVLFGLFQLREFLALKEVQFRANEVNGFGWLFTETVNWYSFFNAFCGVFIFSLLALIFIRGLWIGAIGLRYVSGDIDFNRFKYNEKIKQFLHKKIGSFDDYIDSLENFSSSILAFAYLLFFASTAFLLYAFEVSLVTDLLQKLGMGGKSILGKIIVYLLVLPGAVVAFDFLTLGWLKTIKFPIFRNTFFALYRFVGIVTLSFLWRPILLNFLDQKYAKWLVISIPVLLFSLENYNGFTDYDYKFFPREDWYITDELAQTSFQPIHYDDLRQIEKEKGNYIKIRNLSLSKHIVEASIMKVFVKHTKGLDNFIARTDTSIALINNLGDNNRRKHSFIKKQPTTEYSAYFKERRALLYEQYDSMETNAQMDSLRLNFIAKERLAHRNYLTRLKTLTKQYYTFEINQQAVADSLVQLAFYVHPNLGEKGYICTFPLENVRLGINELTLNRKVYSDVRSAYALDDFSVPFIYEGVVESE